MHRCSLEQELLFSLGIEDSPQNKTKATEKENTTIVKLMSCLFILCTQEKRNWHVRAETSGALYSLQRHYLSGSESWQVYVADLYLEGQQEKEWEAIYDTWRQGVSYSNYVVFVRFQC